jgi:hypothetical protein
MLDVHPPHASAHTWKDFFIHIATIVIGLLIAVGLEQTVEYLHHRSEVRETRKALALEYKINVVNSRGRAKEFSRSPRMLQRDLAIFLFLREHPGASSSQWPGKIGWTRFGTDFIDGTWQTAIRSNVVAYMPHPEVAHLTELYARFDRSNDTWASFLKALDGASAYTILEPDASRLTSAQIDHEIDLISTLLVQHVADGNVLVNMAEHFPEFSSPSRQDLRAIRHTVSTPEDAQEAHSIQIETETAQRKLEDEGKE